MILVNAKAINLGNDIRIRPGNVLFVKKEVNLLN
jgi:hypothetical protein